MYEALLLRAQSVKEVVTDKERQKQAEFLAEWEYVPTFFLDL
jgi:hypothetical protein